MRTGLVVLLLLAATWAQDKPKAETPPKGATKIHQAIVIGVEGIAQMRPKPKTKWKQLAVNNVLKPGVVIRTGRKSNVTLRVGKNATMRIERQSRVRIPEIVEDGSVLRTRVSMAFGKTEIRVDLVGLDNDFEVATPTATLAVRGTTVMVRWDAVNGFQSIGVRGNRIRAVEVAYFDGIRVSLSGANATTETHPHPAFLDTYYPPLKGDIGESEFYDRIQTSPSFVENPTQETGLTTSRKQRAGKNRIPSVTNPNN